MDGWRTQYVPHGASRELWECRELEVLISGPAHTGKTRAALEKIDLAARKYPGMRALILRATRASLTQSVMVTFERDVLAPSSCVASGQRRDQRTSYHYLNGSEIVLGGLDQSTRFLSSEYDIIYVAQAEEIALDSWELLLTRLRNWVMPYQQAIADCNPAAPKHWLKVRADAGRMKHFEAVHADNPVFTEADRAVLERLTGHRRARLLEGRWEAAEGLVWPDLESCFVDPFDPPMENYLGFWGGIDFGFAHPFAALGGVLYEGEDGDDILYIFYERYMTRTSLGVHAEALSRVFPKGYGDWQADPSRPDLVHGLRRAGLAIHGAKNGILAGIDAVNARIQTRRLLLSAELTALRAEAAGYCYGKGEKPIDAANHACDALRYLVMGIDWRSLARILAVEEPEAVAAGAEA